MPLIKSSSDAAFQKNVSEMIASSRQEGTQMGKAKKKYGAKKARQMALAAAFAIKRKG